MLLCVIYIHLVKELDIFGRFHLRWINPMEWYMKMLKGFVKIKARPKGSMVEGYALEEALILYIIHARVSIELLKGVG